MPRPMLTQIDDTSVKQKHPAGRPTDYSPVHDRTVFQMALLGASKEIMAEALNVSRMTFNNWERKIPSFRDAVRKGCALADARVAYSLYQRAIGYDYPSEKLFYDRNTGDVVRADITIHCPPDVAAQRYWLNNRQRGVWTEKLEVTGSDDEPLLAPQIIIMPVKALTKE